MKSDTIVAFSTALAQAAIGIVRLSGPQALDIAKRLFRGKKSLKEVKTHTIVYGHIIDPKTKAVVDEVLVAVMRAPKTYTREDVVEINAHGGPFVLKQILKLLLAEGARLAEPGEFTKRAFLNGRIDLTQAEAVAELISAQSEAAAKAAVLSLKGELAKTINCCQQELINCIAHLEAAVDYSDEDIMPDDLKKVALKAKKTLATLNNIIQTSESRSFIRNGIKTAIVGRPNVGKSSLLNALLKEERAIVTEIAGTTRDVISENFTIDGYNFTLCDTAGISFKTTDPVEQIGINKAKQLFKEADLVMVVLDASEELKDEDKLLLKEAQARKNCVIVLNKTDLPSKIQNKPKTFVKISAKTGYGIDTLKQKIKETVLLDQVFNTDTSFLANERQLKHLKAAASSIEEGLKAVKAGFGEEVLSLHLKASCQNLAAVTGTDVNEAVLNEIFQSFCLGK